MKPLSHPTLTFNERQAFFNIPGNFLQPFDSSQQSTANFRVTSLSPYTISITPGEELVINPSSKCGTMVVRPSINRAFLNFTAYMKDKSDTENPSLKRRHFVASHVETTESEIKITFDLPTSLVMSQEEKDKYRPKKGRRPMTCPQLSLSLGNLSISIPPPIIEQTSFEKGSKLSLFASQGTDKILTVEMRHGHQSSLKRQTSGSSFECRCSLRKLNLDYQNYKLNAVAMCDYKIVTDKSDPELRQKVVFTCDMTSSIIR